MEIIRVTAAEYSTLSPAPLHVFNTVQFNELNKDKCLDLHYLIFKDTKVRAGIILGERDKGLYSPFSAPFGGFNVKPDEKSELVSLAVKLLKEYGARLNRTIKITLPPPVYNETAISKICSAILSNRGVLDYGDINYHYDLSRFARYEAFLSRSARKNFHASMKHDFGFRVLDGSEQSVATAYNIIKANRESHGYPLRMSLQAVIDTCRFVPADFMVATIGQTPIAAAQVFRVSDNVAQVIYWGDAPGYSEMRPMNWFTHKIFEYYHNQGLRILDIGPSSERGAPSFGLCDFKEGIGCTPSIKMSLSINADAQ